MLENYNITCKKCTWSESTDLKNINFFSGVFPTTFETLELNSYIMDISPISYTFENSSSTADGNLNSIWFEASDVTLTLDGVLNNQYLKDFFGLFVDTTYIKYMLHITDKTTGITIWQGIANQENITNNYSTDEKDREIQVQTLSYEKEMKEYFSQKDLERVHYDSNGILRWDMDSSPWDLLYIGYYNIRWYSTLRDVLDHNFVITNPDVLLTWQSNFLYTYNIIDYGCFWKDNKNNNKDLFIRNGYKRILDQPADNSSATEKAWGWLEKTCNAMGWVFFFYNKKFVIKHRNDSSLATKTLDYKNFIEYGISKKPLNINTYSAVVMVDGYYHGADYAVHMPANGNLKFRTGICYVIPASSDGFYNNAIQETRVGSYSPFSGGARLELWETEGWRFTASSATTNDTTFYYDFWNIGRGGNFANPIDKRNILFIDTGDNGNSFYGFSESEYVGRNPALDLNIPHSSGGLGVHNFLHAGISEPPDLLNDQILYKGNYGHQLFLMDVINNGLHISQTYADYIKTPQFVNNFEKFISQKKSITLKVKYDELITSPLQSFNIINYPADQDLSGTWALNNMEIDLKDETTTLELQKLS